MPKAITKKVIARLKKLEEKYLVGEWIIFNYNEAAEYMELDRGKLYSSLQTGKRAGYLITERKHKHVVKIKILWHKIANYKSDNNSSKVDLPSQKALKPFVNKKEPKVEVVEDKIVKVESEPKHITFKGPFGDLTTILDKNGNPWFIAKEVCDKLGYANSRDAIIKNVDEEDRLHIEVLKKDSFMRRDRVVINESGLFSLILRSNLPGARVFKRWVTSEVLPSIRKHGMYATPDTIEELLKNPDTMIKLLEELKEKQNRLEIMEKEIEELSDKAEYGDIISLSEGTIHIGTWIKTISRDHDMVIGSKRAFKWLRENNYLRANNEPYQKYIDEGLFETKIRNVKIGDIEGTKITTFITTKGQVKLSPKIVKSFQRM